MSKVREAVLQPVIAEVDGSMTMAEWRNRLFFSGVHFDLPEGQDGTSIRTQGRQVVELLPLPVQGETPRELLNFIDRVGRDHVRLPGWQSVEEAPGMHWLNGRLEYLMAFAASAELPSFPKNAKVMALAALSSDYVIDSRRTMTAACLKWNRLTSVWHIESEPFSFKERISHPDMYVLAARVLSPEEISGLAFKPK